MTNVAIPDWSGKGVLPPINSGSPDQADRSPYEVSLIDLVLRFATSTERYDLLNGFLRYRRALHAAGLTHGFQWVDGSFLEDIETREGRPPRDIDVVTFFFLPDGKFQETLFQQDSHLFDPRETKRAFHVDAYFVQLDGESPEPLVAQSVYWYSMWSHRRNGDWKGYLQIDLSSKEDDIAKGNLGGAPSQGGQS
jgi:hypothetical protein